MGMLMRKRPCPCGSGRAARECCGRFRRLSDVEIASAHLSRQARRSRDVVGHFSTAALETLQGEAVTLPGRCGSFADALLLGPRPVLTDIRRAASALARLNGSSADGRLALRGALQRADTPLARVIVAKTVLALREQGAIDEHLAAAALIELSGPRSALTEDAVFHTAAVIVERGRLAGARSSAERGVAAAGPLGAAATSWTEERAVV